MSIPGFGGTDIAIDDESSLKSINIPPNHEWRIEVPFKKTLKFKVLRGILEINGTELATNVEIQLSGVKCALYSASKEESAVEYQVLTNKDQTRFLSSEDDEFTEYISGETNMDSVINLTMYIESRRQIAKDLNDPNVLGPRVLVIGAKHSGKTSLVKTLCAYAVKLNECPILVNLNPQDGVFALPGSLSATPVSDFFDVESVNGYGMTSTTTGTLVNSTPKQPLVKNFGFLDIGDNNKLFDYQIDKLGICVLSKLDSDVKCRSSGVIIDTPPLSIKDFSTISSIIADFKVDLVVVLGNEKLKIDLEKKLSHRISNNGLSIIKISKSPGVVELNDQFIRMTQEQTIREYFNGNFKNRLSPFKTEIDITGLSIYKGVVTKDLESSLAFLPEGDDFEHDADGEANDELKEYYQVLETPFSSNLDNSIIAVSHLAQEHSGNLSVGGGGGSVMGKELLNSSVLGYVHVSKVDDDKKRLKVLLPFPGVFPRNVLISTNIGYNE
ncbi:CLP1 [Candida oxycetoniae]|uniref:Polynucleotide 5'-hydroxyl-kinase GRC3 n=1 Tax=Candida oxycetoniae TaxID=497107 RepID=A0AAI9STE4_9ASCO|nr:CLP1 [Candida oxycetoniae]KAI3402580.2 CLP1 [Candida oxycetoniae]